jgi:hypothetical protein
MPSSRPTALDFHRYIFSPPTFSPLRVLIAGDKIYTIAITGAKDKATGKDADAFFDSFKLLK